MDGRLVDGDSVETARVSRLDLTGKQVGLLLIGIFICLFVIRYVLGPGSAYVNVDEIELLRTSIDRLLGVPQTSLAWPSTTTQLLIVPVVFGGVLLGGLGSLPETIAGFIFEPEQLSFAVRFVLMLAGCGVVWGVSRHRLLREHSLAVLGAFLVVLSAPIFIFQSFLVSGDGLAVLLMVGSLLVLVAGQGDKDGLRLSAILMAASVGCRITMLLYAPLVIFLILQTAGLELKAKFRLVGGFVGVALIALVFFLPNIWMEPVRLLKSVLGNAGRDGGEIDRLGRFVTLLIQVGPIACLAGIGLLVRGLAIQRGSIIYAGIIGFLVLNLGVVFERYYLLVLPGIAVGVFVFLRDSVRGKALISRRGVLEGLAAVLILVSLQVASNDRRVVGVRGSVEGILRDLPGGTEVVMEALLVNEVDMRLFDRQSVEKAVAQIIDGQRASVLAGNLGGESGRDVKGLTFSFLEDELAMAGRLGVLLRTEQGSLRVSLASTGLIRDRYGVDEMPLEFDKLQAILLGGQIVLPGRSSQKIRTLTGDLYYYPPVN